MKRRELHRLRPLITHPLSLKLTTMANTGQDEGRGSGGGQVTALDSGSAFSPLCPLIVSEVATRSSSHNTGISSSSDSNSSNYSTMIVLFDVDC